MNSREKESGMKKYLWAKRLTASAAVGIWLALMLSIFRSGGGFSAQAPKCIFTTMIVFGILTAIYKGIEQLEREKIEERNEQ